MKEISLNNYISLLPYNKELGAEIRPLYFYQAMGREIVDARIISFGNCNFSCPYCKRGGSFRSTDGSIIGAKEFPIQDILTKINDGITKNQIIRLSGGDPVVFQKESLFFGEYIKNANGRLSIATNGSDPEFSSKISKYIESAAIDLKATPEKYQNVTGMDENGKKLFQKSIESQKNMLNHGVLVDVRTPIFKDTSLEDLRIMAEAITSNPTDNLFWTLRVYNTIKGCDFEAPDQEKFYSIAKQLKFENPDLKIGIRAKWSHSGLIYLK